MGRQLRERMHIAYYAFCPTLLARKIILPYVSIVLPGMFEIVSIVL